MDINPTNSHCIYRGQVQGKHACNECAAPVRIKIFACALHATCTIGRLVTGHALCQTCVDFEPPRAVAQAE